MIVDKTALNLHCYWIASATSRAHMALSRPGCWALLKVFNCLHLEPVQRLIGMREKLFHLFGRAILAISLGSLT